MYIRVIKEGNPVFVDVVYLKYKIKKIFQICNPLPKFNFILDLLCESIGKIKFLMKVKKDNKNRKEQKLFCIYGEGDIAAKFICSLRQKRQNV